MAGSFQAGHAYLLDALERLGPGFVGVAQLEPSATDEELRTLCDFLDRLQPEAAD